MPTMFWAQPSPSAHTSTTQSLSLTLQEAFGGRRPLTSLQTSRDVWSLHDLPHSYVFWVGQWSRITLFGEAVIVDHFLGGSLIADQSFGWVSDSVSDSGSLFWVVQWSRIAYLVGQWWWISHLGRSVVEDHSFLWVSDRGSFIWWVTDGRSVIWVGQGSRIAHFMGQWSLRSLIWCVNDGGSAIWVSQWSRITLFDGSVIVDRLFGGSAMADQSIRYVSDHREITWVDLWSKIALFQVYYDPLKTLESHSVL